jgi:hypothetical protein
MIFCADERPYLHHRYLLILLSQRLVPFSLRHRFVRVDSNLIAEAGSESWFMGEPNFHDFPYLLRVQNTGASYDSTWTER